MIKKRQLSLSAIADLETVNRAVDGDEKAFTDLLEKYQNPIYFLMLKRVGNEDDAEDLMMDTFAKAFKNLEQYTPVYAFSTWLFRIAINNCIDFVRKKKVRPSSINSSIDFNDPDSIEFTSSFPNPEDLVIKEQKSLILKNIIKKLKPRYAKLIELRYYNEMSYEEISKELNIPVGSVKAQLFRARELLLSLLKEKMDSSNENI